MSRLDLDTRVWYPWEDSDLFPPVDCQWFALCTHPANGVRDHPVLGAVPICQRCDDRMSA